MSLNKEKIVPEVRQRIKGLKLPKTVKRAMALMPVEQRTAYKRAMLKAGHEMENYKRKPLARESKEKD